MRKPVVLITGANGEIGHALVANLAEQRHLAVVSLDVNALDPHVARLVHREFTGSILDTESARAHPLGVRGRPDFSPRRAAVDPFRVYADGRPSRERRRHAESARVCGARNRLARPPCRVRVSLVHCGLRPARPRDPRAKPVAFAKTTGTSRSRCTAATSSIASTSAATTRSTTSSCSKRGRRAIDFRCVRFPGLISAVTVPSGGTSDYASEMIHAAAKRRAIRVLRAARHADSVHGDARCDRGAAEAVDGSSPTGCRRPPTTCARSIPSADEIRASALRAFPDAQITYDVDAKRQAIVDSWPEDVDDTAARRDWDFAPAYDFDRAFHEYLIPTIKAQIGVRPPFFDLRK